MLVLACSLITLVCGLVCGSAHAQGGPRLAAAGDGERLWMVRGAADGQSVEVFTRTAEDAAKTLHPVRRLNGRLADAGLAARGNTLWLLFANGSVVTLEAVAMPGPHMPTRYRTGTEPSIPDGLEPLSFVAGGDSLWLLARVDDAAAYTASQRRPEASVSRTSGGDLARGGEADKADGADAANANDVDVAAAGAARAVTADGMDETRPQAAPSVVLLTLRRAWWEPVDLPAVLAEASTDAAGPSRSSGPPLDMALVRVGQGGARPFVVVGRRGGADTVDVYRHRPAWGAAGARGGEPHGADSPGEDREAHAASGTWERETLTVTTGHHVRAMGLDGQIIVAREIYSDKTVTVDLSLLRPGRVLELGSLVLPYDLPARPWTVVADGERIVLLAGTGHETLAEREATSDHGGEMGLLYSGAGGEPLAFWTAMDLRGRVVIEPTALAAQPPRPMMADPDFIVLVATLILASGLILWVFARREPGAGPPQLAAGLVPADLGRRLLGGAIDLLPWVVAAMLTFGDFDVQHLMRQWPGRSGGWHAMGEGALAIALYVTYCLVAELLSARTLGKVLLGMRVTDLAGRRPRPWRILIRNLLKIPDLIAWPLLLLPMFIPIRQRLGDLVGGTVVIMNPPTPDVGHTPDGTRDDERTSDPTPDDHRD